MTQPILAGGQRPIIEAAASKERRVGTEYAISALVLRSACSVS
jgi:hypothetical protein